MFLENAWNPERRYPRARKQASGRNDPNPRESDQRVQGEAQVARPRASGRRLKGRFGPIFRLACCADLPAALIKKRRTRIKKEKQFQQTINFIR